jgi:hypothetical protein
MNGPLLYGSVSLACSQHAAQLDAFSIFRPDENRIVAPSRQSALRRTLASAEARDFLVAHAECELKMVAKYG